MKIRERIKKWLGYYSLFDSYKRCLEHVASNEDYIRQLEKRIEEQEERLKKTIEFTEMLGKEFSAYLIDKVKREMF